MYWDTVFSASGVVLFNGIPEETKNFVKQQMAMGYIKEDCYVVDGAHVEVYLLQDYISK